MFRSWKTLAAGVSLIATGLGVVMAQFGADHAPDPNQIWSGLSSVLAGVGLVLARDFNVSGGKKEDPK